MNFREVESKVREKSDSVVLVAVSKTRPQEDVLAAYAEGARVFGENRVQEMEAKFSFDRPEDMKVYLIGQLQSNKVKKAVALADRIESVDSIKLIDKIEAECAKIGKTIEILLEVNSSGEDQKSGFRSEEEVFAAAQHASSCEHIKFMGLMTVGPLGFDREKNLKAFNYTRALYDKIKNIYPVSVLSMGMSSDWEDAIDSGSTEIRLGTVIFGERK
ncbi:MAG: YggS family pyridoxal phosphate-dependent enzyme [Spirochaetales bacterium]|nr:YggS family pyridoxal phosphate-dependent enzyme [Spirochaetales bacterium]